MRFTIFESALDTSLLQKGEVPFWAEWRSPIQLGDRIASPVRRDWRILAIQQYQSAESEIDIDYAVVHPACESIPEFADWSIVAQRQYYPDYNAALLYGVDGKQLRISFFPRPQPPKAEFEKDSVIWVAKRIENYAPQGNIDRFYKTIRIGWYAATVQVS
ncbi:hypothetical protein [Leptolyngbya sp. FACHB-541]|uniref:hypothetical protein n=1 Tax=Leptolyngbya sp. FACHB-541 TaxID=2692810 RepID=UPI001F54C8E8|nr:hypothetical protein [Leptolyngbya sp. FACHB-541]